MKKIYISLLSFGMVAGIHTATIASERHTLPAHLRYTTSLELEEMYGAKRPYRPTTEKDITKRMLREPAPKWHRILRDRFLSLHGREPEIWWKSERSKDGSKNSKTTPARRQGRSTAFGEEDF